MPNKFIVALIILVTTFHVSAQRIISPTDSFVVEGKIVKSLVLAIVDLGTYPEVVIKDQVIHNHKGEVKDTLTGLKGVLLKTILAPVEYVYEKPKELNEFYFVFTASDGYRVVFSWNEIYNTEAGNQFYILTTIDGKAIKDSDQRIVFISTADLSTGRRYIKGLQKIEVKKVE